MQLQCAAPKAYERLSAGMSHGVCLSSDFCSQENALELSIMPLVYTCCIAVAYGHCM